MTDRAIDSLIERIIQRGKARLSAGDRAIIAQVLGAYEIARNDIARELMALEQQITWSLQNADGDITEAWIRRQAWYQRLDQSIERASTRLERTLRGQVEVARSLGITEASATWRATVNAAPFMRDVNVKAVERWVSSIQAGSPLDAVLKSYGDEIDAALRREITQGIIEGRGKQSIVTNVMRNAGVAMPEQKASQIVRTEMMRTYRGVYRDQMAALKPGMISGYRWIAALDLRTCPVCIGMHGTIHREYPDYFHTQCRCVISPVFSSRYAPPREYVTGEQWLRNQPEAKQKAVLGGGERYELWRDGMPLNEMVTLEHDPVWGGSSRLTPLRDLRPTG